MMLLVVIFGGALWMLPIGLIAYIASLPLTWGYCYAIGCVVALLMGMKNSLRAGR